MALQDGRQRLPASGTAKIVESSQYDGQRIQSLCSTAWLWTCGECGDSGMTILVQQCPQCYHFRCTNCNIYSIKHSNPGFSVTYQYSVPKADNASDILLPKISSNSLSSSMSSAVVKYERASSEFENRLIDGATTPLSSAQTPDLITASDIGSLSNYSTPLSEVIRTPTSTQESEISSGPFSHREYSDSETDFETDDTESIEDIADDEDALEAFEYAVDILDSHLFSILGHDLQLASRLIPQIHAQLQLGFGTNIRVYTASPSGESRGLPETQGYLSTSVSTPSNKSSQSDSSRNKRERERDESKDRGDKSGSKRPRTFRDESAIPRFLYACHFHKRDPVRYCPLTNPKFNICLGRGNALLRRTKDHYLKAHRPSQCERCYTVFKDRDELKEHRQAEPPCQNKPDTLKEGIDDSQWAKVEPLFRVRRKLSPSQKEQDDFDKWFKIWDILFPDVARPSNPWVDFLPISPSALPNDAEGLLTNFNSIIDLDVERGILQRDEEVHQRYERALRLALQTNAAISAPATSFSLSTIQISDSRSESNEHTSNSQTTIEISESSLGRLGSSQVKPQHLPGLNSDHNSSIVEAQSLSSSTIQFDVLDGAYPSQSWNEIVPENSNVFDTSIIFASLINPKGAWTNQQHANMHSSTHHQADAVSLSQDPVEYANTSNTKHSQDFSEYLCDMEIGEGSHLDPRQDDFIMPVNSQDFEFDAEKLDSESLTKLLESENDRSGCTSLLGDNND